MSDANDLYVDPDRARFKLLKDLDRETPANMLNLIRLREKAEYTDGREATGAEAYAAYGRESGPIFRGVGGSILWSGTFEFTVIGPPEEYWDIAFIAHYPTAQAFLDMVYNPDYQKAVVHRQAAVLTSRLERFQPREVGAGFGE
ncbi:MAG: DUF1330 domain-containing protein [Pseudomonadota bacterium]